MVWAGVLRQAAEMGPSKDGWLHWSAAMTTWNLLSLMVMYEKQHGLCDSLLKGKNWLLKEKKYWLKKCNHQCAQVNEKCSECTSSSVCVWVKRSRLQRHIFDRLVTKLSLVFFYHSFQNSIQVQSVALMFITRYLKLCLGPQINTMICVELWLLR